MFQEERLLKILEYLNERQSMSVNEICERFQVSRDTARRDIVKLVDQGAAIRTHGGISLPALTEKILAYRERVQSYSDAKMSIGKKASSFLQENQLYYFDVSTTVSCLTEHVDKKINIFTHSLDIAEALSNRSDTDVFLIGGSLNRKNRFFFDMENVKKLDQVHFDCAFFGAAAVMEDGIYFEDKEDAYTKSVVVRNASKIVILADGQKFKKVSHFKAIEWKEIDVIITNETPPELFLDIMKKYQIQLIIVE
ncbi:DeoR/GlpR family DNA-binding transcription regulator [Bacillus sp. 03113]|uniref:DeoR/GlpR family DNA-binding transcription regulator n=1 Tax=Bacillus sp. 03113 TaxID=2578211 RepID=UPI001141F4BB|nr:DeoR/GlpR family DNA-binding transcription regulator [Bacillus sp. 03113]